MKRKEDSILVSSRRYWMIFGIAGLIGIAYSLSVGNILLFAAVLALPLVVMTLIGVIVYPSLLMYIIFVLNYFIIGIMRYADISGLSFLMDLLFVLLLVIIFIHGALKGNSSWKDAVNVLTIVSLIWMVYCLLEFANPSGVVEAWVMSRNLIYNGVIVSVVVSIIVQEYNQLKTIVNIYAVLSLLVMAKALMQKFIGFDSYEMAWLIESESIKTHVLITGVTRYFSFLTDAGSFGSNMGAAAITFSIMAFSVESRKMRIFYGFVGALTLYGMFMSGTRGAMIVPLGGLAFFVMISKNFKAMISGGVILLLLYVFFAFTYIGESNGMISRMRSAFRPNNDPSFLVRKRNQATLAEYMKNKPFGEGLGLSGVENRRFAMRLTTNVPHDSWYVKLWVETGPIGITIYLLGFIIVLTKCSYILMFKVKEREVKGVNTALVCGVFGLLLSAYGNAFFGQFPTSINVYTFLALALKSHQLEKSYIEEKKNKLLAENNK